jgi:hypothetical protein
MFRMAHVHENHPVLTSLTQKLGDVRESYRHQPNEHTRYQLVRYEQLIAQWAPGIPITS